MAIEEQLSVIYCGVWGLLDKQEASKIAAHGKEFLQHCKTSRKDFLATWQVWMIVAQWTVSMLSFQFFEYFPPQLSSGSL